MKRALGQGSYEKRDQSRGSDENDKGSRGRGKGRVKRQKVKGRRALGASLQALKVVMLRQLRIVYIGSHCVDTG